MAEMIMVRGTYGLLELPACGERTSCCGVSSFYSAEHDNFYCATCKKGQGNEYYSRNRGSIEDERP